MVSSSSQAATIGRREGNPVLLMPRLLPVLLMIVALAGCSTTTIPAVSPALATAGSHVDATWRSEVLAVVLPLADRRLATGNRRGPATSLPLLPLGLVALGRASGEPRFAEAATWSGTMPMAQPSLALINLCAEGPCSAEDLLQRPELWTCPGIQDDPGPASLAALDPPFRRMAATRFDREALLFQTDGNLTGQGRFDASLNATAFAALTRMVDGLPAEDPARLEYVALYREMARTITRVQGGDGWWRETLGDEAGMVDRSASALFVFGLTWGLNTGMLSFNEGETAALKGWDALRSPAALEALQTEDTGLGALMLAAAQMAERQW
jgi:hypothetical protein